VIEEYLVNEGLASSSAASLMSWAKVSLTLKFVTESVAEAFAGACAAVMRHKSWGKGNRKKVKEKEEDGLASFTFCLLISVFYPASMAIPLEDLVTDVVGKAQRGLGIDDTTLADRIGIEIGELDAVKSRCAAWLLPRWKKLAEALELGRGRSSPSRGKVRAEGNLRRLASSRRTRLTVT